MKPSEILHQNIQEAQQVLSHFLSQEDQSKNFDLAVELMVACLKNGGKIISCGNGGSMCDAMHFAEELSGRFRENRRALAAVSISDPSHISCVGNDYGYNFIFSRYLEALGKPGDVLLGISTSGNSGNVLEAIKVAKEMGMKVVGLTGKGGGKMRGMCDAEICAPTTPFADRAQELHIKIIHSFIQSIEAQMG
jgi:D-sedoheptulose 7-phosphate isomerase